ncbi:MAG: YfiR family protein [bacterium]|nr:YfiR family protein [bacterium]
MSKQKGICRVKPVTKGMLLIALIWGLVLHSFGDQIPEREYIIKAGFMYKFLMFVQWPETPFEEAKESAVISILGKNEFGDMHTVLKGKPVQGKKLVIKYLEADTPPEVLKQCHILYISSSLKSNIPRILESIKDAPVLTVSDVKKFCTMGGILRFVVKKNAVRFEVNTGTADYVGVKFRSKLLRVATRVIKKRPE